MPKGRILLGFLTYSFTLSIIIAAIGAFWTYQTYIEQGPHTESIEFTVKRGSNIASVSDKLEQNGLIRNALIIHAAGRITGQASKIKAGEYKIPAAASMKDILARMVEGKTITRRFTVREGLTSYETVNLINNIQDMSNEVKDIPVEGVLLPNTYDYQKNQNRLEIIQRLKTEMETTILQSCLILLEKVAGTTIEDFMDMECSPAPAPLQTINDVLTLASIVEKETAQADERAKVAGVFLNRLRIDMPLQTDPTVIYAITKGKHKNDGKGPLGRRLLKKDLQIDDPYNTYKYAGLPPGPIANPGKASIKAVLNPEDHEYLYFVADGTGGHAFAKTLKSHNANVAQWRKIRRKQKN